MTFCSWAATVRISTNAWEYISSLVFKPITINTFYCLILSYLNHASLKLIAQNSNSLGYNILKISPVGFWRLEKHLHLFFSLCVLNCRTKCLRWDSVWIGSFMESSDRLTLKLEGTFSCFSSCRSMIKSTFWERSTRTTRSTQPALYFFFLSLITIWHDIINSWIYLLSPHLELNSITLFYVIFSLHCWITRTLSGTWHIVGTQLTFLE